MLTYQASVQGLFVCTVEPHSPFLTLAVMRRVDLMLMKSSRDTISLNLSSLTSLKVLTSF